MRPCVCLYPCSACCKIVQWYDSAMYLLHNPNAYLRNYVFLFLCEDCFVDSIFQSFSIFDNMFNNGLVNDDFGIPNNLDIDQFINNPHSNEPVHEETSKKYFYIDDNLKALLTQDNTYLKNVHWNKESEENWEIGHRFNNYKYAFSFFINNYEPELEFIPVLLRTITENYNIPLLFDKKFIDYAIANSKLSEKDKLYFNNKRIHQLRIDYMNLERLMPKDIFELLLQY